MTFKGGKNYKKIKEEAYVSDHANKLLDAEENKTESEVVEISYTRATFWKRCSIILFDFLTCLLIAGGVFILTRKIVVSSPNVKKDLDYLNTKQIESGLYIYNTEKNQNMDLVEYYDLSIDLSEAQKYQLYKDGCENFFTFVGTETDIETENEIRNKYEELKFNSGMNKDGTPLFIKDENNKAIENYKAGIKTEDINNIFMKSFIRDVALSNYFITKIPKILDIQKMNSNFLLFLEVPVAIFFGFTIVYYIVPLCFNRGKQTLGRVLFKTGLVNSKDVLAVSAGKFTVRYLIFLFGEVYLSLLTLGIPLFVSFSLMAFSKKKQNFHDYMLGIEEVDISSDQIYKNMDELLPKPQNYDIENFNSVHKL